MDKFDNEINNSCFNNDTFDSKTLSILGLTFGENYKCDLVDSDDEDEDMIAYKKNSIERKKRLALIIQQNRNERDAEKLAETKEEEKHYNENVEVQEALQKLEKRFEKFKIKNL